MPSPLPSAIRDDVSYALPVRPLGPLRWLGWFPVGFALFFLWMPVSGLIRLLNQALKGTADTGEWFGGLFYVPFIVGGLIPFALGLFILFGRCRVEWRQKRLSILDHAGLVRWRRRLPKGRIRKFTVRSGGAKINDKPVTSGPLAELGALLAEFEVGRPRMVAFGYPRDWLQALAEDLSARVGATASALAPPAVELTDLLTVSQPQFDDVTHKPADSRVKVEPRSNGFVLLVPPAGLRKGSKGLFGFSIIWCLFMSVFTGFLVFASGQKSGGTSIGAWAFIGLFWLVGLGMLAGAINMGRRRAMLLVENGRLSLAQIGIFGAKKWDWNRDGLSAIRADASGMAVNDVPVIELQIHPVGGKKAGFFAGRDEQELRWLATELRRALKLPAAANPNPAAAGKGTER
ncbi:MAG TPA: hypothetical protein VJW76_12080 [Verrucomicrobiae bacterium]|nr:hypothetical protein [Verrucomicrobiae bacterium]